MRFEEEIDRRRQFALAVVVGRHAPGLAKPPALRVRGQAQLFDHSLGFVHRAAPLPLSCSKLSNTGASVNSLAGSRLGDLDALPEGDAVLDPCRGGLRIGVVPGGVLVAFAVDVERVVVRGALPRTHCGRVAAFQHRCVDVGARKIMVALDHHRVVTMGDDLVVPDSLDGHETLLRSPPSPDKSHNERFGSMIRTGIGGWVYPDWRKGNFYPDGLPQKRELEWASRQLGAIEINGTYHSLQKPES